MEIINVFKWIIALCYTQLLFFYSYVFYFPNSRIKKILTFNIAGTIILHLFYLIYITIIMGRLPLGKVFEVMTVYVFLFILIYYIIELSIRDVSLGFIIVFIALILQCISNFYINTENGLMAVLSSVSYFKVHVIMILFAYSAFTISSIASIMYIMLSREIHSKQLGFFFSRLPSLELLDRLTNRAIIIGVSCITCGIFLGIFMATQVWETGWHLDPKLISVFLIWLIYIAFIYLRNYRGWQGKRASIISIIGFVWLLIAFIIFSIFLPNVHSFI